jgi:hypothetical protein
LFKIATQAVSLWYFHVYMFHLLYFSSFYLSPFLMVVSFSLKILCSFLYRKYNNHVHPLNFLLLSSLLVLTSFSMTCFSKYCLIIHLLPCYNYK